MCSKVYISKALFHNVFRSRAHGAMNVAFAKLVHAQLLLRASRNAPQPSSLCTLASGYSHCAYSEDSLAGSQQAVCVLGLYHDNFVRGFSS